MAGQGDDPKRIQTIQGRWLYLTARGDDETKQHLPEDDDDAGIVAVIDAAFEVAVRRRFAPDTSVRDITLLVSTIAMTQGRENVPPIRDMEAVVRAELGEPMPISDLDAVTVGIIKVRVFARIVGELTLFDRELEGLLAEAEALAFTRGFHPTLLP